MPASAADSALYRRLFGDDETARLFTDTAEIRAMLMVEGALAQVQGDLGLIPREAAAFLQRACLEVQIDPEGLAQETAANGVCIPALISAFRVASNAPDFAQYLHWGATSQDIIDTGLALRLRPVLAIWRGRIEATLQALAGLAEAHAALPMAARTYGQIATPGSFGACVAAWGRPLMAHRAALEGVSAQVLQVSLGGASGTLAAMGPQGAAVRAGLAKALGLRDPGRSWHAEREGIAAFGAWMAGVAGSLGKMGEDLILLTQSGIAEVSLGGGGASSTMPQKQNPVGPSVMVALARQIIGLQATMQGAALHRQNRDGAAWFTEWLTLPQMCISLGRMLALAEDMAQRVTPVPAAMARGLEDGSGMIHAEAFSFALASLMPRPEAQAVVKALCKEARATGGSLIALIAREYPALDVPSVLSGPGGLGTAPDEAQAFAAEVRRAAALGG